MISAQVAPAESQRRQRYVKLIGVVPFHAPFAAVSVEASLAVPAMVGSETLDGASAATTAVVVAVAEAEPAPFAAVTVAVDPGDLFDVCNL